MAIITITVWGRQIRAESGPHYLRSGLKELLEGDPEKSQIYFQKAIVCDQATRREAMFYLARAYEEGKQLDRADALMASLAPSGKAGFPGAHRYLALRMSDTIRINAETVDPKTWYWHLQHADEVGSAPVQTAWGTYYAYLGQFKEALKHFRSAAEKDPAVWLQVAELEFRLNDLDSARRSLVSAKQGLRTQFVDGPKDFRTRMLYATSLIQTGELANAEMVLLEGLAGDSATPEEAQAYHQFLAAVFVRAHDQAMDAGEDIDAALRYLRSALKHNPESATALARLAKLARSSPEMTEQVRGSMRSLIASGKGSALAHFTLGTVEWVAGNQEVAALNMRQGLAIDPSMHVLANNLAYMLAEQGIENLEVSLRLADQAVQAEPKQHRYWDTRATVLMKMGRLADAAVDFQKALEQADRPEEYQLKLAELYDQLGDRDLADRFRRAARE